MIYTSDVHIMVEFNCMFLRVCPYYYVTLPIVLLRKYCVLIDDR